MNEIIKIKAQLPFLLLLLFLFSSCHVLKRRYSNGFYVNNGSQPRPMINNRIEKQKQTHIFFDSKDRSKDLHMKGLKDSIEMFENEVLAKDKLLYFEKKQLSIASDSITKKLEKSSTQKGNKLVKPKMEMFSKLALIAMLVNFSIVVTLLILVLFFTIPSFMVPLLLPLGFLPGVPLLLAYEGKFRVKKNPEKYLWPRLAELVIFISIWLYIISLFNLMVFVFKETFGS
jgi:hypothetical protein